MRKSTVFMMGFALVALSALGAKAETSTVPATTTTEVVSPDGTTTTIVAPAAPASQAPASTNTPVVGTAPVVVDAISGEPASNTTAPHDSKERESLRDRVRDKMD